MILKYFIRFKLNNTTRTRYIKARSYHQAITKLINSYKVNDITYIAFEGDPLPSRQLTSSELIQKKNDANEAKRRGALKYYQMTGKNALNKNSS
jgi:hypothetical protein